MYLPLISTRAPGGSEVNVNLLSARAIAEKPSSNETEIRERLNVEAASGNPVRSFMSWSEPPWWLEPSPNLSQRERSKKQVVLTLKHFSCLFVLESKWMSR